MIALLLSLAACAPKPAPIAEAPVSELNAEAVAGVSDQELRVLLSDHWEYTMRTYPTWATVLGDRRFDDRLEDVSEGAIKADREATRAFLARAEALDSSRLGPDDALTLSLFEYALNDTISTEVCEGWQWMVSAQMNPFVDLSVLAEIHTLRSPDDGATLLVRYRAIPAYVDASIADLRAGMAAGRVPNAESVAIVVEQVGTALAKPTPQWELAEPATSEVAFDWPDRAAFAAQLMALLDGDVKAAFTRYEAFLRDELLPVSRPPEKAGLTGLPDGAACYEALIRSYTTTPLTAAELHQTGLSELERIHGEMEDLGERLFGTRDLATIIGKLRTDDPAMGYPTPEAVIADATAAVDAVRPKLPEYFGRLPKADVVVRPIPDHEAPYSTIAYYRQPNPDGSKPGEYFINTYAPETRLRWQARAVAFHEAIPGHHLQIAISQELPALPAFRRYDGYTAFVEGWGLYAEGLADEMGVYPTDLDEMGRLTFDSWRAARLVVDTGVHAQGWTREQAVTFMLENTALAENNIVNEVDRYITWPGQALAYKVGQLEIRRLRAGAEATLGDRFDIKAFHDVVLGGGAVPLDVLKARVAAWVAGQQAG